MEESVSVCRHPPAVDALSAVKHTGAARKQTRVVLFRLECEPTRPQDGASPMAEREEESSKVLVSRFLVLFSSTP